MLFCLYADLQFHLNTNFVPKYYRMHRISMTVLIEMLHQIGLKCTIKVVMNCLQLYIFTLNEGEIQLFLQKNC